MQGDLGEFNQCQCQLKELYEQGVLGAEEEFTAYRMLYFIMSRSRTGESREVVLPEMTLRNSFSITCRYQQDALRA